VERRQRLLEAGARATQPDDDGECKAGPAGQVTVQVLVTRLVLEGGRAVGVELRQGGKVSRQEDQTRANKVLH
jgi:hypothetical protein